MKEIPDTETDTMLVARAKAGDMAAFEKLVFRHESRVYGLALRILRNSHDAEDTTQQAFLSALENLEGFRGESGFSTWLLRIATHAALKIIRKRRGLNFISLEEHTEPQEGYDSVPHPEFIADWRETPDKLAQQGETRELIEVALEQLDEKHRMVFVLRDVEGLSIEETAQVLDITENNVKVRLLRARLQLREHLTRLFGNPAKQIQRGNQQR